VLIEVLPYSLKFGSWTTFMAGSNLGTFYKHNFEGTEVEISPGRISSSVGSAPSINIEGPRFIELVIVGRLSFQKTSSPTPLRIFQCVLTSPRPDFTVWTR
jgi:hypothetical protein